MIVETEASPSLDKIASALRETTETLAVELAEPGHEAPLWSEFDWQIAWASSSMQGISPLLCRTLRWQGPSSWQKFLCDQRDHSVRRHREIARLLAAVDSRAQRHGIAMIGLKGAALHAAGLYEPGERPMGDIDLLLREQDAEAAGKVLEECGYVPAFVTMRHRVFQPKICRTVTEARLGEHVDNPIKIEIHTKIAESLPVRVVDITESLLAGERHPGLNDYPSLASLMMHLLLHAAGNMRARALRQIQLHDIALLAARFRADDWEELLSSSGNPPWWALAPLLLTARYYRLAIPAWLFARLDAQCPRLLKEVVSRQRLADVSWSNIRIEAFPGLEWSRSPAEALTFMAGRVWPGRVARSELQEGAGQIPNSASVPWYGLSHVSRILRWIFSKPPRVQTLLNVRAALAHK